MRRDGDRQHHPSRNDLVNCPHGKNASRSVRTASPSTSTGTRSSEFRFGDRASTTPTATTGEDPRGRLHQRVHRRPQNSRFAWSTGERLTIQGNAGIGLRVSNSRNGRFLNLRVVGNHAGGAAFADGADDNEIRSVSFIRNGADGLVVAGDANMVAGNWATANAGDGFVVEAGATSTQLSENRATGNTGNGFSIESAGTRLKANVAQKNTKRGIDAVGGTSDAGNNQASGNGDSPQCAGVNC